jgi:L-ascorbate metabolism protein UlaG (beta-lactamase superfamily)
MNQNFKLRILWMTLCSFTFIIGGYRNNASARNNLGTSDSLKYIGHSFVKIKTLDGKVIYIDPFNVNEFADSADVILVTHEHSDHNDLTRVKPKTTCQIIRSANAIQGGVYQSFTIGSIKITAVAAYNANHPKSSCVGYVVQFDGIKLYHAGDTGLIPEMADLANQNITYALLPMDGIYTMSPEEATQAAVMIHARFDIPIHTMPPTDTYSDAIVARFTSPNKIVVRPGTTIDIHSAALSVEQSTIRPEDFRLEQNYPNPFNPTTVISYQCSVNSNVKLSVFDILGKEVTTLVNEQKPAGSYAVQWNAAGMPSGIYFYKLQAGKYAETKKLVLIK